MRRASLGSTLWWLWVLLALATLGPLRAGPDDAANGEGGVAKVSGNDSGKKEEKNTGKNTEKNTGKNENQAARAPAKAAIGPDWLTWDQGLLRARDKYLPVLIFYNGQSSTPPDGNLPPRSPQGDGNNLPPRSPQGDGNNLPPRSPQGDGNNLPPRSPQGDGNVPAPTSGFEESLQDSSLKDVLKHFVLIRLGASELTRPYTTPAAPGEPSNAPAKKDEKKAGLNKGPRGKVNGGGAGGGQADGPPDGPSDSAPQASGPALSEKFSLSQGKASLVVLSFWEEEVLRYDRELPPRSKLKSDLTRVWKVNEIYAREARRVEAELSTSRYAYRLNNYREAVLKIKPFEGKDAQVRLDPVLKKRVNEVIQEYKAKANEAIGEADKLDREKKYAEAINAFDAVCKNFPFLDILQHANRRKGEILRKVTFGG